jgi:hypothetical protein
MWGAAACSANRCPTHLPGGVIRRRLSQVHGG